MSSAFDYGDEGGGFDEDVFERKFQEFVARKLQAVWRGKQQRKQYLAERRAAQFIQAQFRVSERKRLVSSLPALGCFRCHAENTERTRE